MDKNLEKMSALYDGELSQNEMQEIIKKMDSDESMRNAFYKFGLISELMQRHSEQQKSKITYLQNYYRKLNPLFTNLVTAAATVLLTLIVLYQFDDDRFKVDKETSFQLSSAISSDQAKIQLLNADKNIMELFPDVQFYDYTKLENRFTKGQKLPANYHLTFSRAEDNDHKLPEVLKHTSAAVVFSGELPATWRGYPVIDGDEHDARFTDAGAGVIIGLRAKGRARHDASGFVVWSHGTDSTWN